MNDFFSALCCRHVPASLTIMCGCGVAWSGLCAHGAGISTITLALSAPHIGIRTVAARCIWRLSRNNGNKCLLYHAGAVPLLITLLRAESQAERAPAMAGLWNLSLRSKRCEEIREQMIQCKILPALAAIAEITPNAMVRNSDTLELWNYNARAASLAFVATSQRTYSSCGHVLIS